jgi:hypothetical protein
MPLDLDQMASTIRGYAENAVRHGQPWDAFETIVRQYLEAHVSTLPIPAPEEPPGEAVDFT